MPAAKKSKSARSTIQQALESSSEEDAPPLPRPIELADQPLVHLIDDDDGPVVQEVVPTPAIDAVVADEVPAALAVAISAPPPTLIAVINPMLTGSAILDVVAPDLLLVNPSHEPPSLPPADVSNLLPVGAALPAPLFSPRSPSVMPALPALQPMRPTLIGPPNHARTVPLPPVPRFNQPPKPLRASIIPPSSNDDGTPVIRLWEGPKEIRLSDGEEDDFESNPFGIQRAPKEKPVVLHPAIVLHMGSFTHGRRNALRRGLSEAQVELLTADFLEGLDYWESTWCCQGVTMWQSLEASRYAECNPEYGRADVDLAAKLLVPIDVADDAEALKKLWSIKTSHHYEGSEMFSTRFAIVPYVKSSSGSAASLGSSRGRTPSPAQASDVPPLSPRPAAAAGVSAVADNVQHFTASNTSSSSSNTKATTSSSSSNTKATVAAPTCVGASFKHSAPAVATLPAAPVHLHGRNEGALAAAVLAPKNPAPLAASTAAVKTPATPAEIMSAVERAPENAYVGGAETANTKRQAAPLPGKSLAGPSLAGAAKQRASGGLAFLE